MADTQQELESEQEEQYTRLGAKPCGNGLYYFGGDIVCVYPLLGTEITKTSVLFKYEKYDILVEWDNEDNDGNIRTNPRWTMILHDSGGDTE